MSIQLNQYNTNTVPTVVQNNISAPIVLQPTQRLFRTESSENTVLSNATYIGSQARNQQSVVDNPLHEYDSYTYGLSLHLMDINVYNSVIGSENPRYIPQNVLVASAGKYSTNFVRDPRFKEDFYFDQVSMKTIVNTTSRNRNSNLVEAEFTIIEPNGFTFINRLIEAANSINTGPGSYIHMPYMLQIDFYGIKNGELGQIEGNSVNQKGPIPSLTKFLPIRITNIKSRLSSKGTEYKVSAIPFNHQAYTQMHIALPIATSVTGSSVAQIFNANQTNNNEDSFTQKYSEVERISRRSVELQTYIDEFQALNPSDIDSSIAELERLRNQLKNQYSVIGITGYCDAINDWNTKLKLEKSVSQINTVKVIFHNDIGNASLLQFPVNAASVPVSGTSTAARRADFQAAGNAGNNQKGSLRFDGGTINIPAGMSIEKLIDWAVRNSSYICNQISDPEEQQAIRNGQTPIRDGRTWVNWFKIIPRIKIGQFDPLSNRYKFDIIYYVKPYKLSSKHPFTPKGRVGGYVKRYEYLFTGKNQDILDLSLDFDTLYVLEMAANRNKLKTSQTSAPVNAGVIDPILPPGFEVDPNTAGEENVSTNLAPVSIMYVGNDAKTNAVPGANQAVKDSAASLQRSLMISARGDMINLNMKIVGDPHFIKQDDVYSLQTANNLNYQFINNDPNNSLYMDGGELYVFVNFQSPSDYNEELGIADVSGTDTTAAKYKYSEFSGVYKIIEIDNTFSKGKFEQNLLLAKLLYDQEGQPIPSITQRAEIEAQKQLVPAIRFEPTRFAGPSISISTPNRIDSATQDAINRGASAAENAARTTFGDQIKNLAIQKVVGGAAEKIVGAALKPVLAPLESGLKTVTDQISGAIGGVADNLSKAFRIPSIDIETTGILGDLNQVLDPYTQLPALGDIAGGSFDFSNFSFGDVI